MNKTRIKRLERALARCPEHTTARLFVRWPDGSITRGGIQAREGDIGPGDNVFNVRWAGARLARGLTVKNCRKVQC